MGRPVLSRTRVAAGDIDNGYVRLHPAALEALGLRGGSLVMIEGRRSCVRRAEALSPGIPGEQVIRMAGTLRDNLPAGVDDRVRVRAGAAAGAFSLVMVPDQQGSLKDDEIGRLHEFLNGRVVGPGDKVNLTCLPRGELLCRVVETEPSGPVLISADTLIQTRVTTLETRKAPAIRYEEIGGLDKELKRVRELVELPMKYPQLFAKLRIQPPRACCCSDRRGRARRSSPARWPARWRRISSRSTVPRS